MGLKGVISKRRLIPLDHLTLLYSGEVLSDSRFLLDYGIKSQDVINCVTRSEAGTKEGVPSLLSSNQAPPTQQGIKSTSILPSAAHVSGAARSVHKPKFLIRRDVVTLDENAQLLTEDEVEKSISFWHEKAALGKFDPDVHIVAPLAHYASLEYLERDVILHSEYFRCRGDYDTEDYGYNQDLARIDSRKRIQSMTWSKLGTTLDGLCSPSTEAGEINAQSALRELRKELSSLQKSYELLCNILAMLDHLKQWYFCTDFYSILTWDRAQAVAALTAISEGRLVHLKFGIEYAVDAITRQALTSDSATWVLISRIADPWWTFFNDILFRIAPAFRKDAAIIPELCRMTTLALDLALVSYVGSHGSRFDSQYLKASPGRIKIPSRHRGVKDIVCSLRPLACLSEFVDNTKVWLFDSGDVEAMGSEQTQKGLKVLTHIRTFADIWGPVWSVGSGEPASDIILQYNLSRGCIRCVARGESKGSNAVECHWYNSSISIEEHHKRVGPFLRQDDLLLIGGRLQSNDACMYTINHFQGHFGMDLCPLGTFPETFRLDSRTLGITAGQYVTIGVSGTQRRQPGVTLKENILNKLKNNPDNANIEWLNHFLGLEISHCTGNAKRVRLKDLFCLPMVQERLSRYDANWTTTTWGAPLLNALEDTDFETMRAVWNDRDKRRDIANLICQLLELLHHTGEKGERLVAAYFHPRHADKQAELSIKGNEWARCLRDSNKIATFAVIVNKCLKDSSISDAIPNCTLHHCTKTVFQTQIMFRGLPPPGVHFIRLNPHQNMLRVERIETGQIILQAEDQLLTALASAGSVAAIEMLSSDENTGFLAIIKAAKNSYGGTEWARQVLSLQGQQPNAHPNPPINPPELRPKSSSGLSINMIALLIAQALIAVIILGIIAHGKQDLEQRPSKSLTVDSCGRLVGVVL